jgi:hypothetical protein
MNQADIVRGDALNFMGSDPIDPFKRHPLVQTLITLRCAAKASHKPVSCSHGCGFTVPFTGPGDTDSLRALAGHLRDDHKASDKDIAAEALANWHSCEIRKVLG